MKRKIIRIDDTVCNGCGQCLPNCPEGALQIIDGKARLVSDLFCDGLGACIGTCPLGAIAVEEREAEPYDERRVMAGIIPQGENVIRAHLEHLRAHGQTAFLEQALAVLRENGLEEPKLMGAVPFHGCPGSRTVELKKSSAEPAPAAESSADAASELRSWPVQLQLLNPNAPFFEGADLLIAADCVPFAHAGFHRRVLRGKVAISFCPKREPAAALAVAHLAAIFKSHSIRSITVVRMEVPCCGGTTELTRRALRQAGQEIPVREYVVSLGGKVRS
jgi:NAD-dependent dihydropyrimidine dehydrogenase PreA subunit